jgi:hypothetical protein
VSLVLKPDPVTTTVVPVGPTLGESVMVGKVTVKTADTEFCSTRLLFVNIIV